MNENHSNQNRCAREGDAYLHIFTQVNFISTFFQHAAGEYIGRGAHRGDIAADTGAHQHPKVKIEGVDVKRLGHITA